jgi:hypothetical protein
LAVEEHDVATRLGRKLRNTATHGAGANNAYL